MLVAASEKIWPTAYLAIFKLPCRFTKYFIIRVRSKEVVYVTIGNPAFCLVLCLTGVHFRGELQHVGDVNEQKIKCRPIRIREIDGVRL